MSFMSSLASNPGGGISGQPAQENDQDTLSIVNQIKDREMMDFQNKAKFMSGLSIQQDRLRRLYKLDSPPDGSGSGPQQQNTVMASDPNQITPYQKGELGIRQQDANTESQKLAQTGQMGQEAADTKSAQEKLNQQKSDQINADKNADMQRKTDEANQKIALAQKALEDKTKNSEDTLQAHKDYEAAVEERHKLEIANLQNRFDTTSALRQKQIDEMQKRLDQAGHKKVETTLNADGTKKTVDTTLGSTVQVKGKDGQTYEIPADKVDDWNANHAQDGEQ